MKELQEILKRVSQFKDNERAILATVVEVVGSGYRRAGARMLIDANGYSIGTISGGCLEADVLERAKHVLETGQATIITYDTTKDENSIFGLGMGCRGVIRVLLEPFGKESFLFRVFEFVYESRFQQFIATIISSDKAAIGGRIFYDLFYQFDYEATPEDIKEFKELTNDCEEFFLRKKSAEVREYRIGDDAFELFFENINPPLSLLLFGAGFDALPLLRFAKELGWRVIVIDHRAAFANRERLPEADDIIVSRAEDLPAGLFRDENSVAVIMTHNYERDREILHRLLNSECRYIGALGPRSRTENLIQELRGAGGTFDEINLAKLHAPIGLDIGSETPEEIALAVIAEIKCVLSNRTGRFLRERNGSINGS
ncbi:MAG TPA: XdhC/CoxI family protein [Pyrinomonadaceae bacterium]|nr:XdhC/CoxI family protein [Pyrinomonadaceae bacterium]